MTRFSADNTGFQLENVIHNELVRRGYSVEVGTLRTGEVDFVARRADETVYVQVCETMVDPATRERELGPLRAITDAFPKCVISLDRYGLGTTGDGIKVLGAIDWLLGHNETDYFFLLGRLTTTARPRRCPMKKRLVRAAIVYGAVWLACLAFYWGFLATGTLGGGGIMGYVILALGIALPIAGVVTAFLVGRVADLGWWRLAALIAIAVLYVLHTVATFSLSNALGFTNIAPADLAVFIYGLIPAAIGLAVGCATAK